MASLVAYLPGDANADGLVNGADYTLWADNYGETVTKAAESAAPAKLGEGVLPESDLLAAARAQRGRQVRPRRRRHAWPSSAPTRPAFSSASLQAFWESGSIFDLLADPAWQRHSRLGLTAHRQAAVTAQRAAEPSLAL